jgi:transcriptional regulator with XRE-family HTH domain
MQAERLTVYEAWDSEKPLIPKRSRLYQLEPVGIGTPYVESLTGYISRFAETHSVLSGMLILGEIAPFLRKGYVYEGKDGGINKVFGHDTKNLNGTGNGAANLVQVTETLTHRHDLCFLTLLTWGEIIPQRDLPKRYRAWCSTCYEQWRVNEQVIYEPLLWSLKAVKVCPLHRQVLCEECPHCKHKLAPLAWKSQPGYCSKCLGWLGVETENAQNRENDEIEQQLWVANNVGELLSIASQLPNPPSREKIKRIISAYINQIAAGNLSAFVDLAGLNKQTVWGWYKGKTLPSLDTLLKLCQRLGVSLTDFLVREVVVDFPQKALASRIQLSGYTHLFDKEKALHELNRALEETPPPSMTQVQKRLGYNSYATLYANFPETCLSISTRYRDYKSKDYKEKLQSELEAVLASDEYPPPSLKEVARRLNCSPQSFYNNFPELSYAIAQRYTSYKTANHEKLMVRLSQEVRLIATDLHSQRIEPTARRVAMLLSKPGAIRNLEARKALHEVRRELGWQK